MKKSHIILSILSITLLAALSMEAMQPRAIETRANTQYKKFIEAFKCLKKKGWKQCSPEQKRRIVATGLALIGIVGTTITVITWKSHMGRRSKNDQPRDLGTPEQKAKMQELQRRKDEEKKAAEAQRKEREKKYRKEDAERKKKKEEFKAKQKKERTKLDKEEARTTEEFAKKTAKDEEQHRIWMAGQEKKKEEEERRRIEESRKRKAETAKEAAAQEKESEEQRRRTEEQRKKNEEESEAREEEYRRRKVELKEKWEASSRADKKRRELWLKKSVELGLKEILERSALKSKQTKEAFHPYSGLAKKHEKEWRDFNEKHANEERELKEEFAKEERVLQELKEKYNL